VHYFKRLIVGVLALFVILAPVVPAQASEDQSHDLAGWLARSLAVTNDLALGQTGTVDYASTTYAILGLKGTGVAGDQIVASAEAMAASGEDFISGPEQIGAKATAIALMILAQDATGLDPRNHATENGTRDLYADLTSAINSDGSISEMPSAYGQAFAILALLTSEDGVPQATIDWLLEQPCVDTTSPGLGGYGFSGPGSCDDADPDSTALAIIALRAAGVDLDDLASSAAYLTTIQDSTGGFVSPWSGPNANTTGLAVAALTYFGQDYTESLEKAKSFLTSLIFDCEAGSDLAGAMALDTATFESTSTNPYSLDIQVGLFQAGAQGIFGLIGFIPVADTTVPTLVVDVPGPMCESTSEPPTQATGIAVPIWLGVVGGIVLLSLAIIVWRVLASRRK
jgi:hypothetical protein